MYDLNRFIKAQEDTYQTALQEIRSGRKRSHFIWYIFPQMAGLGRSEKSFYYGIRSLEEAKEYLAHPVLGERLREIVRALAELPEFNPRKIFGEDAVKVHSCLTLFYAADPDENLFTVALGKYYDGRLDEKTIKLIGQK